MFLLVLWLGLNLCKSFPTILAFLVLVHVNSLKKKRFGRSNRSAPDYFALPMGMKVILDSFFPPAFNAYMGNFLFAIFVSLV